MTAVSPVTPEQAFLNAVGIAADLQVENDRLRAEHAEMREALAEVLYLIEPTNDARRNWAERATALLAKMEAK